MLPRGGNVSMAAVFHFDPLRCGCNALCASVAVARCSLLVVPCLITQPLHELKSPLAIYSVVFLPVRNVKYGTGAWGTLESLEPFVWCQGVNPPARRHDYPQ